MLKTVFWQKAANSLPPAVRARHIVDIQRAENFERVLVSVMDLCAQAREAFSRMFEPRRPSHGHR
jgi:hypothetical protein